MRSPKTLLANYVVGPVYNFIQKYIGRSAIHSYCKKVADFIFVHSKETAVIMLIFNAISILSSHIAQIGGLKRSGRENKDYLITQEWQELGLDLVLTIIPPFLLNNFLMKKFDSGQWTTKFARNELIDVIAPTVGASRDDLYSTQHIKPLKESITDTIGLILSYIKNSPKIPNSIKNIAGKININPPDPNKAIPMATMEDITTDFDIIRKGNYKRYYNGKAYDEISGQRNGYLIMATIAYTILASNVLMPILKNLLANRSYKKQLKEMGETPESIKRKKRFKYTEKPVIEESPGSVFNIFSNYDNTISKTEKQNINEQPPEQTVNINDTFKAFETFNKISSKSTGLRI